MSFFNKKADIPGSERTLPPKCERVGNVDGSSIIDATVILRRRGGQPPILGGPIQRINREQFGAKHGADTNDAQAVEKFAQQHNLTVADTSLVKRRMILRGTIDDMSKAFHAKLAMYKDTARNCTFRGRSGSLSVPEELNGVVIAVLGLDNREVANAHFRVLRATAGTDGTFTAQQVAALYNFPKGLDGTGQTIGIVELGGGYNTADLQTYFQGLGLNVPSVTAVSVDGGTNSPGSDADGEVELDIEVSGTIAPGAKIAVYFAPNTDQGFIDAVTDAIHDTTNKPSVVSISWGGPEDQWTTQSRTALDAAMQDGAMLGVTIATAAGDNGSSDGVSDGNLHVDFPSSSTFALACGGTTLQGSGTQITSETVWNETAANEGATGGGVSNEFALPSYQQNAGVPADPNTNFVGRGVPDVAGNADPETGYQIVVDGQSVIVGGTSAVAPLWAGLIALINQKLGTPVGMLQPQLYSIGESVFHDITSGNNDNSGLGFYSAQAGWDPCTGLGSPNGAALLNALITAAAGTTTANAATTT